MTTYSLTIREDHFIKIQRHLLWPDGNEHVAYIICSEARAGADPWDRETHRKFLSYEVVTVPDDQVVESTPQLVTWRTATFVSAIKKARAKNQFVAIIHNHPAGMTAFSAQDDVNERDLIELAQKRNGPDESILSVILTPDGELQGRIWLHPNPKGHSPLRMIRVMGKDFRFYYPDRGRGVSPAAFHRQALAFGQALNQDLSNLRIAVVGCGGTGSAVAALLARLGVGQIVLIDNDIVDRTNLNRLHGARQADADAMLPKVIAVARSITELGLGVRVVPVEAWVGDPGCRDALRACDLIFGCTDDNEGRLFLNRLAFYYLTPVIDVGLAVDVSKDEPPEVKCLDGRVTVIIPTQPCLSCRGVIDTKAAHDETLRRTNPTEYTRRKAEAYVAGEGDPRPAVVTFTTEVATMGVNEMLQRIQGFRGPDGAINQKLRKFHLGEDFRPGSRPIPGCRICDDNAIWGRGDIVPFLDRIT
ncbi:MAG: ThiF family adenylyltransferase [Alphaproteobacteria bacterium]|nr:ThiF family adenylyltransferase [Alphaproteobacteria bacterium]